MNPSEPIPFSEVAVLDANAEALGVEVSTLMAAAGQGVAEAVLEHAPEGPVLVLCGPGNNGGDGLVAAGHLVEHREVSVLLAGHGVSSSLAREALEALPSEVAVRSSDDLDDGALRTIVDDAACLVDGLLGAGIQGEPRGEVARLVDAVRASSGFVVSIDAPTGAGTPRAIEADVTVALHAPKQLPETAHPGELVVVDIGIPERAWTHTGPGEFSLYPRASQTQHKGQGGFVLIIGGGPYAGAPALAAMAAMRAGADLAFALVPEPIWHTVASFSPNMVARPMEGEHLDLDNPKNRVTLNKWLGAADAVVIGPGLGKMDPVRESVPIAVERVSELGVPMTLDADALWAMAESELDLGRDTVLTPHAHEFRLLTGRAPPDANDVEGRVKIAQDAARELGSTMLLKGPVDVIADGERAKRNATGTPAMSHGGTGDILTGIVAALQAKGLSGFDAARLGAYISGKAGELATEENSYGMIATDVLEAIPKVLRNHLG